ncbi:hypothetical protein GN956_G11633 [Arapaima gigas]
MIYARSLNTADARTSEKVVVVQLHGHFLHCRRRGSIFGLQPAKCPAEAEPTQVDGENQQHGQDGDLSHGPCSGGVGKYTSTYVREVEPGICAKEKKPRFSTFMT